MEWDVCIMARKGRIHPDAPDVVWDDLEYKKAMEAGKKIREMVTSIDAPVQEAADFIQTIKDDIQGFEKMVADVITGKEELPHTCDFCNHFSGNIHPGVRPAKCHNKESKYYGSPVEENHTCEDGDFTL